MTVQTAGRFTLLRKLPAGGMGRVFEADDPHTGRRVALKLIDLGADADSQQIVKAERLGAELQKQLCATDSRVTQILEFGEMPGYFYIVMEYVEGEDVSEIAHGKGLAPDFAARVAQDVLEVLDRAHTLSTTVEGRPSRGIVHGDVKPRNIRITPDGSVKVLDFGIAKALSMTRNFTQNVFASVQYSSPERMATGEMDASSDLWGVAVVLYELLAGHPYFEAETGSKLEHLIRNYRQLPPLPANWPEPLRQVVARALSPDPRVRYRTAAEFAIALQRFRNGEAISAAAPPPFEDATRRVVQNTDATVRTQRREAFQNGSFAPTADATRKTVPNNTAYASTPKTVFAPPPPPLPRRRSAAGRVLRIFSAGLLIIVLVVGYMFVSEYMVWRKASQLASDLSSEKQQNLDAAWREYSQLASRSHVPVSLWSAKSALRDRFMSDADHTITRYQESDVPAAPESDWMRVRAEVAHALELDPNDKNIHGKLRLIDGHLARIRGSARRDGRLLEESRQDFQDAAKYMKKSPDPWLGLARLDIYSLHDIEGGEAAIKEAERRGHDIGKRETAELADGYRYQGERAMDAGRRAPTPADADRDYQVAGRNLDRARELYESILPWAGATTGINRVNLSQSRLAAGRSAVKEP